MHRYFLRIIVSFCLVIILCGCVAVTLPTIKPVDRSTSGQQMSAENFHLYRLPQYSSSIKTIYLPDRKIRMPLTGENNSYGITTTIELESAYRTFLGGDVEAALLALQKAELTSTDPLFLWQVSFLKSQSLIMLGRSADAEVELEKTERYEKQSFGHNWNSLALLGEIKVWIGDLDGAIKDLSGVVKAIDGWTLPTSYALPPSNIGDLVAITTAQLRSYTSLAGAYLLKQDYETALYWAKEAEKRFNDVHYVADHPLYGGSVNLFADSYYGRAMNLSFLATAELVLDGNLANANILYDRASILLDAIGYQQGRVIIASLRTLGLYNRKDYDDAVLEADTAIELATEYGLVDMVWRVETLRGKLFFDMGQLDKAEKALRRAQTSVDTMSGALATDRAKLRFGVGKEDITYYLVQIDIHKKDYSTLFQDLERGRARAFVDMLANSKVAAGEETSVVFQIKSLDTLILKKKLAAMAPDTSPGQGHEKEIDSLLRKRKELINALRSKNNDLADVLAVSASSLDEIMVVLQDGEKLAYVLPARQNDAIRILLIDKNSAQLLSLKMTISELRNYLDLFAEAMEKSKVDWALQPTIDNDSEPDRGLVQKSPVKSVEVKKTQSEHKISRQLFDGLQIMDWDVGSALYVVPSGDFYFVPWGILDIDIPVAVLPNGSWVAKKSSKLSDNKKITIVGDPAFGGNLVQLPGAKQEAIMLGKLHNVEPLLGNKATEENLRAELNDGANILHLATHGIYYPERPLKSAIYLSHDDRAKPLTAKDIFEKPLPAKLVVLSACETGLGKNIAGDDMLGLVRSFYLGGTTSVLSSLWPVEDSGTKFFMKVFHEHAKGGSYGKAWLTARDSVKEAGFPPWIYGAFVLGGRM